MIFEKDRAKLISPEGEGKSRLKPKIVFYFSFRLISQYMTSRHIGGVASIVVFFHYIVYSLCIQYIPNIWNILCIFIFWIHAYCSICQLWFWLRRRMVAAHPILNRGHFRSIWPLLWISFEFAKNIVYLIFHFKLYVYHYCSYS